MEYINTPKEITNTGLVNTKDLYFIYESDVELKVLRPQTYEKLISKIGAFNVKELVKHDAKYRPYLSNHHNRTSFLHCSIAGFSSYFNEKNLFDSEYYTYYFKLTLQEIEKCAFSIKNEAGEIQSISGGITGIASVLKKWSIKNNNKSYERNENVNDAEYPEVNVVVPFKVKPMFCLKPFNLRKYYHGSTKKLKEIKAGTFVTPYIEDAKSFAVPWTSKDLIYTEHEDSKFECRPPKNLLFKSGAKVPRDRKIYVYVLENVKTISSKSKYDKYYPWNRVLLKESIPDSFQVIDSWKKHIKNRN